MGKEAFSGNVAGGPNAGNVGSHPVIYGNTFGTAVHANGLCPPGVKYRPPPHGHQHHISLCLSGASVFGGRVNCGPFDFFHFAAKFESNLFHGAAEQGGLFPVHKGDDFVHHFDNRYFRAKGGKKPGEFHADYPAADNGKAARNFFNGKQGGRVQHQRIVFRAGYGRQYGNGTGADQNCPRFVLCGFAA